MKHQMRKMMMAGVLFLPLCMGASTVSTPSNQSQQTSLPASSTNQVQTQPQAQQWGLSDADWGRYQSLMKGARGIMSPGLDPLTTLGVETDNSAERRRLAELWVKHEYARAEKELAFQREINTAWLRLYPETLAVNMGNAAGIAHDTQGRLALFVKESCSRCDARLAAVIADNRPVDIYLVGSDGSDDKIRAWAISHGISVDKVRSRQITLNHDRGLWQRYGQGQMPVVLQQGEEGWQIAAF
ncbi:integrating conjugative element protein [Citrobacter koseri]|nr:integrating conjugative element protein [Citrobacter koseri]BDG91243.1 integrating conjugative element protein [Citrobacter koseri]